MITFIWSITNTTAAVTLLCLAAMPFITAFLGFLFLKEKISTNVWIAIIIATILLVVALVALERKFGLVTKSVEMLGQIFEILSNKVDKVLDSIKGVTSAAAELGDALTFGPISGVMNLLGGR